MSAFREAVKAMLHAEVTVCPKCAALDLPNDAKPTLEPQQDGSLVCTVCAHQWRPESR